MRLASGIIHIQGSIMTRSLHVPGTMRLRRSRPGARLLLSIMIAAVSTHAVQAQWTKVDAGGVTSAFLFALDFQSPTVGYAIGSANRVTSVYATSDGGSSWRALTGVQLLPSGIQFLDANTGLAGGRASGCGCLAISRTTDGGQSWELDSIRSANGKVERVQSSFGIYAFSFVDAATGFACGTGGTVVKTTDAGATWTRLATPNATDLMANLSFADASHGYVVASPITDLGSPNILYRTSDGGATWDRTEGFIEGAVFGEVKFINPSTGFVGGSDGHGAIYRTTDGGATWSRVHSTSGAGDVFYGIDFEDQSTGYAIGSGGMIVRTTDGGATWSAETSGTTEVLQGISIHDGTVYVVGANGTFLRRSAGASGVGGDRSGSVSTERMRLTRSARIIPSSRDAGR